jgi:hypothetical protein
MMFKRALGSFTPTFPKFRVVGGHDWPVGEALATENRAARAGGVENRYHPAKRPKPIAATGQPADGETNLTGTRIGELICFPVGHARRVIRLTLGVGSVRRIAEFRQQPTVEIEPQPTLVRFALRSA